MIRIDISPETIMLIENYYIQSNKDFLKTKSANSGPLNVQVPYDMYNAMYT